MEFRRVLFRSGHVDARNTKKEDPAEVAKKVLSLGDRNDAFRSIRSLRLRTFLATSAGSSFFVLRASTRPRTSGFFEPCFAIADQVAAPWTRSRPIASAGVSTSSSKIFETSPKYVKRVKAAAPLRVRMRSSP